MNKLVLSITAVALIVPLVLVGCGEDVSRYRFLTVILTEQASAAAIASETLFTIEDFSEQVDLVNISQSTAQWEGGLKISLHMELSYPGRQNSDNAMSALTTRSDVYIAERAPTTLLPGPIAPSWLWIVMSVIIVVVVGAGLAYQIRVSYKRRLE